MNYITMQLTFKDDEEDNVTVINGRKPTVVTVSGQGKSLLTEVKGELYPAELMLVNDLVDRLKRGGDRKTWERLKDNERESDG